MTCPTREEVIKKISYLYLSAFIFLISAYAFLFAQMREKNKKLGLGNVFGKELKSLMIVLGFFGTTYLLKFVWYQTDFGLEYKSTPFYFISDFLIILDGLSFRYLLQRHRDSFLVEDHPIQPIEEYNTLIN